jgi:hypothetical protein
VSFVLGVRLPVKATAKNNFICSRILINGQSFEHFLFGLIEKHTTVKTQDHSDECLSDYCLCPIFFDIFDWEIFRSSSQVDRILEIFRTMNILQKSICSTPKEHIVGKRFASTFAKTCKEHVAARVGAEIVDCFMARCVGHFPSWGLTATHRSTLHIVICLFCFLIPSEDKAPQNDQCAE